MLIFASGNLKADCPYGSNMGTITYPGTMGCLWTITFCWSCQQVGTHNEMWISNVTYSAAPTSACNGTEPPLAEVQAAIIKWVKDIGCSGLPCDPNTPRTNGYIDMPMCQKWINKAYYNEKPPYQYMTNTTYMSSCETNLICRKKFTFCTDYSHTPPVLDIQYFATELIGDVNACPITAPVPPTGKTYQEDWVSDCFKNFLCIP